MKKNLQPSVNYTMTKRIVKYQCIDSIGQRATFTTDETGKQNSPSFLSFYDLMTWARLPANYPFLAELRATNPRLKGVSDYRCIYCMEYAVKFDENNNPVCDNH